MTTTTPTSNAERLNLRLPSELKQRIERAAKLEGKTVSRYIVDCVSSSSMETIEKHTAIALGQQEAAAFIAALSEPPVFNERMQNALTDHKHTIIRR